MKRAMCWLLGLAMTLVSGLAFANATAFSVTGTVSTQTGTAAPRPVRQGDIIPAGDTVATAAGATVVLRFPDGQIAALTPNSRMTITTYQYNEQAKSGNVLLSLITGGMRAVTGLIGRSSPDKVSYRAATATIGIRGTDVNIVVNGVTQTVAVTVADGIITFRVGNQVQTVTAGQAASLVNGVVTVGTSAQISALLAGTDSTLAAILTQALSNDAALNSAVSSALSTGTTGGDSSGGGSNSGNSSNTGGSSGSAGGGGGASPTPSPTPPPPPS